MGSNGNLGFQGIVVIESDGMATVGGEERPAGPAAAFSQAHPNPSHSSTAISFVLAGRTQVEVEIHDFTGRLVRKLAPGVMESGAQVVMRAVGYFLDMS